MSKVWQCMKEKGVSEKYVRMVQDMYDRCDGISSCVNRCVCNSAVKLWAMKKAQEKKMNRAEMRMLRWMCGVMGRDKIRDDMIAGKGSR
eukprot:gene13867-4814_t